MRLALIVSVAAVGLAATACSPKTETHAAAAANQAGAASASAAHDTARNIDTATDNTEAAAAKAGRKADAAAKTN
jgi:hypothetical protein